MHKEKAIAHGISTSIEDDKIHEGATYGKQLGIIFNRPQKLFYLRDKQGDTVTLIKRVMVLTPSGWQLVPEDPADYAEFIENYLS